MEFRVHLVQMPCVEERPDENRARARWLLSEHKPVCEREFIVLPELFDVGLFATGYENADAGIPGPTLDFLKELAREHSAYVVATGIEPVESKYYNTLVVTSPNGELLAKYRKVHPFQEERKTFLCGDRLVLFEARGMKVGVEICYDLRFPELSRTLALEGAELILIPAAFPDPRSPHWNTLLAARAIENQLYVAAANRIGFGYDGKTYFGHSQLVDPWGVLLSRINSEERVVTASGDTSVIESVRQQITCYDDRMESVYSRVEWFRE